MALAPMGRLSSRNLIRLGAAALVGWIVITGREVDPLILAALLSALAVTPAPKPEDADHGAAPTEQETTDDN
jgi:hypothetical protein